MNMNHMRRHIATGHGDGRAASNWIGSLRSKAKGADGGYRQYAEKKEEQERKEESGSQERLFARTTMEEEDIGLLRSKGIPCASVMRIAPGTDDVELRLRIFFREHNHLHGHAIVISYRSDTNPQNPEDEDDESYFYIRAGADDSQLQSRVIELMVAAPDRAVCVRTSAANGRIGLMLHRLPLLLITVRCMPDTNVHIERAILAGSSAPVLPSTICSSTSTGTSRATATPKESSACA